MRALVGTALFLAFVPLPALAGVVHVSPAGPIATIQAGVDAASAGDTVKVKAGVYRENVVIGAAKTGLAIKGSGEVVIDARPDGGAPAGAGILVQAEGVTIDGITVQNSAADGGHPLGSGLHVAANGFKASHCLARACDPAGFEAENCSNVAFTKCSTFSGGDAFRLDAVDHVRLTKCSIRGAGDNGISVSDGSDVRLHGCRVFGASSDAFNASVGSSSGLEFLNCRFELVSASPIEINDSGNVAGVTIRNCRFRACGSGIFIGSASNVVVRGNRFDRIEVDDVALDMTNADQVDVEDNVAVSCGHGGFAFSAITGLVVRNNVVADSAVTDDPGFDVDADGATLEDNHVIRCVGPGFSVSGASCDLRGNVVSSSLDDGYFVEATATGTLLDGNVAKRCAAEGLDHRGTGSTIRNNTFRKCRLDLTNDGTAQFTNNSFKTGGENVPHEID